MRKIDELKEYLDIKADESLTGWDFSNLNDRIYEEPLPWDYKEKVNGFLRPGRNILDLGTGGGEFLLSLGHPYELTAVTEGYEPNYKLCMKRLAPLGIRVEFCDGDSILPFMNESFNLVINRHESYNISEIFRVLKPGGYFVTQQVGGSNNRGLSKKLIANFQPAWPSLNLENEVPKFLTAGFRVLNKEQSYTTQKIYDLAALCYYAEKLPWEFPDFSVERDFESLMKLQTQIEERGYIESQCHRFLIVAKKPG